MEANSKLKTFLFPYDPNIQKLALQIREFITELVPQANELIWDNYNAVAMAYSKSEKLKDAFCHIAVYSKHVNFGFNRGAELNNSNIKLEGKGKLIRHIVVKDFDTFMQDEVVTLVREAIAISEKNNVRLPDKTSLGKSIVKSISEKKLRPS